MDFRDRIVQIIKDEFAIETIDQAVETERFEKLIQNLHAKFPELASKIEDEFIHAVSHTVNYIVTNLIEVKFAVASKQELKNSV